MIVSRLKSGVQRSSSELEISDVDEAEGHGGEAPRAPGRKRARVVSLQAPLPFSSSRPERGFSLKSSNLRQIN
jgi:hypothetical protein